MIQKQTMSIALSPKSKGDRTKDSLDLSRADSADSEVDQADQVEQAIASGPVTAAALESIYVEYRQALFTLALSITGSQQLAEDAIHDVFAKLFQKQNLQCELVPYVFKSIRNTSIDLVRKRKRGQRVQETLISGYVGPRSVGESPDQVCTKQEIHSALHDAIQQLPAEQRDAVLMKAIGGLTFEEAGRALNVPTKTVATRYRRALIRLEKLLEQDN